VLLQDLLEFFLGEDDDLQELVLVRFIVQEFTENLQAEVRQLLPLVDDEDDGLVLVHAFPKEIVLDAFLPLPVAVLKRISLDPQRHGHRLQEFRRAAEGGVQQEMRLNIRTAASVVGKFQDQLAAERRLPRSHLAQDDVKTAAESDRELDLLKTALVLG